MGELFSTQIGFVEGALAGALCAMVLCATIWRIGVAHHKRTLATDNSDPDSARAAQPRRGPVSTMPAPASPVDADLPGACEIIEGLPVPAFIKNAEGVYELTNSAFSQWFELAGQEVIGKTDRALMPTDLGSFMIAGDREVFRFNKASREVLDVVLPSGAARTVDLIRFPLQLGQNRKGVAGLVIDTTAHTLDKLNLSESIHQAELANRSKSEFLANMSHELRTPLNAIIGFSEMIKTEMMGPIGQPSYAEYGGDIYESATHLLGLINDILDLSKIEAGSEELAEEAVLLPDLISAVITLVKSRAHKGGIRLTTDIVDPGPVFYVDKRKVKQILVNLLTNAIKFTPQGGQVTLRALGDDSTGDFVFQVIDTGVGMAEEDIPRALSPFSQLDRQLSRKHEGTGLGLPLTKRMVEMHFGSLKVVSSIGEGTTIIVQFPATRVSWPDQESPTPGVAGAEPVFGNT